MSITWKTSFSGSSLVVVGIELVTQNRSNTFRSPSRANLAHACIKAKGSDADALKPCKGIARDHARDGAHLTREDSVRDKRAYGARAKGSERDPALVERAAGLHQVVDDDDVLIARVAVLHTHDAAIAVAHLAADDDGETGKRFKLVGEQVLEALRRAVVREGHAVDIRAHELGDQ